MKRNKNGFRYGLRLNKRAVLFSLMAVLFSVLFFTIFSQNLTTIYEDRIPGSNIRIKVMDTYVKNFEKYAADSVKVSAYHTLDALTNYSRNKGKFFADSNSFKSAFRNCMICGYVDCSSQIPANDCNLGQYALNSRLDNMTALSMNELNIRTNYTINSIDISQNNNPFEVQVTINVSYNVSDNSEDTGSGDTYYARWSREKIISLPVSIIGLLDPTGYINDSTKTYNRIIRKYSGICEFNESCWNFINTQQFYQENSFRYYRSGTSFLERYWNDNTPSSCCGLETIIHPSDMSSINLNNSYVDHYYWSGQYVCGSKVIVNITLGSQDVHLDQNTALRYGLAGVQYCPP